MQQTLTQIFLSARLNPDRPAITLPDRVVTYRMLVSGILSVDSQLKAHPLDRDHVIGVAIDSPARHLIVSLALAKNGYASAPLTPGVLQAAIAAGMKDALCDVPLGRSDVKSCVVGENWFTRPFAFRDWSLSPIDPARIARVSFTSGSTGTPKAIGHSHRAFDQRIVERILRIRASGTALCSFGIGSNAGFTIAASELVRGNNVCFDATPQDAVRFLQYGHVMRIMGSPARLRQICRLLQAANMVNESVAEIIVGGAPMDAATFSSLKRYFNAPILNVYASTEAGNAGAMNLSSMDETELRTVCFVPMTPIRIGDDHATPGQDGPIHVSSMSMGGPFTGAMREDHVPEWFTPGDIGHIDKDGLLVLTGRADHLVNAGGIKKSVDLIESLLRTHIHVSEAALIRHDDNGRLAYHLALVASGPVSKQDLEALLEREGIDLAIDRFVTLTSLPHSAIGKIDRDALRKELSA